MEFELEGILSESSNNDDLLLITLLAHDQHNNCLARRFSFGSFQGSSWLTKEIIKLSFGEKRFSSKVTLQNIFGCHVIPWQPSDEDCWPMLSSHKANTGDRGRYLQFVEYLKRGYWQYYGEYKLNSTNDRKHSIPRDHFPYKLIGQVHLNWHLANRLASTGLQPLHQCSLPWQFTITISSFSFRQSRAFNLNCLTSL